MLSFKEIVTGCPTPYSVQTSLEFDSVDQFKRALTNIGEKVLGDVTRFTNTDPILIVGDEIVSTPSKSNL